MLTKSSEVVFHGPRDGTSSGIAVKGQQADTKVQTIELIKSLIGSPFSQHYSKTLTSMCEPMIHSREWVILLVRMKSLKILFNSVKVLMFGGYISWAHFQIPTYINLF